MSELVDEILSYARAVRASSAPYGAGPTEEDLGHWADEVTRLERELEEARAQYEERCSAVAQLERDYDLLMHSAEAAEARLAAVERKALNWERRSRIGERLTGPTWAEAALELRAALSAPAESKEGT